MAGFVKLEKRKITAYKDGAIYKTKVVGTEWFEIENQPECYVKFDGDYMWATTSDYHFGPTKP